MTKLLVPLILAFLTCSTIVYPQAIGGVVYGEVGKNELLESRFKEIDSSAHAVVLYSGGEYAMEAKLSSIFSIRKTVHRRIRILDREGLEYAKVTIPYVRFSSYTERVGNVRANVYTLVGDSVAVSSMERSAVKDLKDGFSYRRKEFEIPGASEGCVIEYMYEITGTIPQYYEASASGLLSDIQVFSGAENASAGVGLIFPKWYFQEKVPVLKSELHFRNFDEYKFAEIISGADKISREGTAGQIYKVKKKLQYSQWNFSISTGTHRSQMDVGEDMKWLFEPFEDKLRNHIIFSAENLPAIKYREPYVINPDKYRASVEFAFQGKDSRTDGMQAAIQGWADVDNTFHSRSSFSRKLFFAQDFYRDTVNAIMEMPVGDKEKVRQISRLIKGDIQCISYGVGPHITSLKDVFRKKRGSDMEINALALTAFKGAGFNADLVMFKSRDRGVLQPGEVSVNAMNSAVVRVTLKDGTKVWFDPRDNRDDVDMLNSLNLVKEARVFGRGATFEDLSAIVENRELHNAVLNVDGQGMLNGKVTTTATNHSCYGMMGQLDDAASQQAYFQRMEEDVNGVLTGGSIIATDTINHIFRSEYTFRRNTSIMVDDRLFINPFAQIYCKAGEFASEYREHPLEFNYPRTIEYTANITVPQGYEIAELPQNRSFVLNKAGASVSIKAKGHGNIVMLGLTVVLSSAHIPAEQYRHFREWWEQACALFDEMIVLKKKGAASGFDNKRISV